MCYPNLLSLYFCDIYIFWSFIVHAISVLLPLFALPSTNEWLGRTYEWHNSEVSPLL